MAIKIVDWPPEKIRTELYRKNNGKKGLQTQIARKRGVNPSLIPRVIDGHVTSIATNIAIAEALGVAPEIIWPTIFGDAAKSRDGVSKRATA